MGLMVSLGAPALRRQYRPRRIVMSGAGTHGLLRAVLRMDYSWTLPLASIGVE